MKKCLYAIVGLLYSLGSYAQESSSAYTVLKLPVSAHASALGGENISAIEDTPWVGWSNPALYSSVSDRSLGLSFMTYASGSSWMGAQFVKGFGERHTAAFSAQYLGYGSMDETDANGQVIGLFRRRTSSLAQATVICSPTLGLAAPRSRWSPLRMPAIRPLRWRLTWV